MTDPQSAPLPERIERAKHAAFLAAYALGNSKRGSQRLIDEAEETEAALDAAIRDTLAMERKGALEEAIEGLSDARLHVLARDLPFLQSLDPTTPGKRLRSLNTLRWAFALATPDRSPT